MSEDIEEFLTVAEVADRLKMNQQTIRNWIDRGELPAIRLGGRRVRIRQADLDEFVALSTAGRKPDSEEARAALTTALSAAEQARDREDESAAWRRVARAANNLARATR